MLITPLIVAITGLFGLWFGLRRSVRGYQDDRGFHAGAEPLFQNGVVDALTIGFIDKAQQPVDRVPAEDTLFDLE